VVNQVINDEGQASKHEPANEEGGHAASGGGVGWLLVPRNRASSKASRVVIGLAIVVNKVIKEDGQATKH
jgi:hypothetical protein